MKNFAKSIFFILFLFAASIAAEPDTTVIYEYFDETLPDSSRGGDAIYVPITFDLTHKQVFVLSGASIGLGYSFFKETDFEVGVYFLPAATFADETIYTLAVGAAITLNSLIGSIGAEFGPVLGYSYKFFTSHQAGNGTAHEIFFAFPLTR